MTKERSAIIETAQLVYNDLQTPYQDDARLSDADEDVEKIAAAILAERERCAKIAEETCGDEFFGIGEAIAEKIRKGE